MKSSCHSKPEEMIPKINGNRRGFSLILSLVLMGMCLTLTVSLLSLVTIELQLTGFSTDRARARMNATFAARLALSELQLRVGRDQAATTPFLSQGEPEGWLASVVTGLPGGILAEKVPFSIAKPVPLVSGNYFQETPKKFPFGLTEISPASSKGERKFPSVFVPWVGFTSVASAINNPPKSSAPSRATASNNTHEGRFAFWVQDESQKADAGTVEAPGIAGLPDVQINRQLVSPRLGVDSLWGIKQKEMQLWREGLSRAYDWGWLELAWREGNAYNQGFPLHPRLYTNNSCGVLSDARNGGLRINWDQRFPEKLPEEKLPCSRNVWEEFFLRSTPPATAFSRAPAEGVPITPASIKEFALRRFPILSGLRVSVGVFHAHSDAYNRIRFHVETQLWNPYPYPLTCVDKEMIGLFDIEKAPRLFVKNLNTGNVLTTDMSAFPIAKFTVPQTESDNTINANLIFTSEKPSGMKTHALLAGEVYHFLMPEPVKQPQGLERTISATKWYIQSDPKKPNTPPPSATDGNWLHATHKIEINVQVPPGGVTIHIREAKGKFATSMYSKDYSQPVLTLKNIPFNDLKLDLSGADFDRDKSESYRISDARFAFYLRLRNNDPERILAVLKKLDPRNPVLDFNDADTAALYEVISDLERGKNLSLPVSRQESFWWDAQANKHLADNVAQAQAFANVRVFDYPSLVTPLSVGVLRHLPREKTGAGSLNPLYPENRESDTDWFDKAFFAGAWPEGKRPVIENVPEHWTRNPWLVAIGNPRSRKNQSLSGVDAQLAEKEDAAANCFTRGVINVNTTNEEAWKAALARVLPDWQRQSSQGMPQLPKKTFANFLPRLPYGTDQARPVAGGTYDFDDGELYAVTPVAWQQLEGGQGFRALDVPRRDRLAQEIIKATTDYHVRNGRPFRSLREFSQSGILAQAIGNSQINERLASRQVPAPMSPLRLNPGDILESLLPALAVRGDTFKIRVRGSIFSLAGGERARADAELTVQRFPDYFDSTQLPTTLPVDLNLENQVFGRRLKIINFRWLAKDEE